ARGVRSPRGVERRDRRHRGRRGVGGGGGGRPHRRGRRRRATLVVEGGEGGGDRLLPGGGVRWRDVGGPEGVARRRQLRRPGGDVGPGPRRGRRLRVELAVDQGRCELVDARPGVVGGGRARVVGRHGRRVGRSWGSPGFP